MALGLAPVVRTRAVPICGTPGRPGAVRGRAQPGAAGPEPRHLCVQSGRAAGHAGTRQDATPARPGSAGLRPRPSSSRVWRLLPPFN